MLAVCHRWDLMVGTVISGRASGVPLLARWLTRSCAAG